MADKAAYTIGWVVLMQLAICTLLFASFLAYNMPYANATRTLAISAHGWCTVFSVIMAVFATSVVMPKPVWALVVANSISSVTDVRWPLLMTAGCFLSLLL